MRRNYLKRGSVSSMTLEETLEVEEAGDDVLTKFAFGATLSIALSAASWLGHTNIQAPSKSGCQIIKSLLIALHVLAVLIVLIAGRVCISRLSRVEKLGGTGLLWHYVFVILGAVGTIATVIVFCSHSADLFGY